MQKLFSLLSLTLCATQLGAQAGDQPFEDVDIIRLETEQPKHTGLGIGWRCDALVIDKAARYRPGHCQTEEAEDVTELTLEQVEPGEKRVAPKRQNRLVY